jgi:hypothetical protein
VTTVVHLVAPPSVAAWLPHFQAPGDPAPLVLGAGPTVDVAAVRRACAGQPAAFLSAHETLLRDRALADHLSLEGYRIRCQSHRATVLGVDKLMMKEFLRSAGFATLDWQDSRRRAEVGWSGPTVVKSRYGTQSAGIRLVSTPAGVPSEADLREPYCAGVEYSVCVYRDDDRCLALPPVWKGATRPDLLPPWRRLRLCPAPAASPVLLDNLTTLSLRIAERAEVTGHLEIEYLVPADGEPVVCELNPRVSGTLRLAAMAAGLPVFSPDELPTGVGCAAPRRSAAEAPYDGPVRCDPAGGVFATSRLTVVTDRVEDLPGALDANGAAPHWPATLIDALSPAGVAA